MATQDVPGANPANADELHIGCWAEHADGSLIFVKGVENDRIVYEMYDLMHDSPVYYPDAMEIKEFKKNFSFPPVGVSKEKWTWHDKTTFPWDRVMNVFQRPIPIHSDINDAVSAVERIAKSLNLRMQKVREVDVNSNVDRVEQSGKSILNRLESAFVAACDAFRK